MTQNRIDLSQAGQQPATQVIDFRLTIDVRIPQHGGEVVIQSGGVGNVIRAAERQVAEPVIATDEGKSLVELHDELLTERDVENRVSAKTIRENRRNLKRFEDWFRKSAGQDVPILDAFRQTGVLWQFAEHIRSQPRGGSASMCQKALATIGKLAGALVKAGVLTSRPESVSKSKINILRPRTEQQRRQKAVPVTVEELQKMMAVLDGCRWPKLGKVKPSRFWEVSLVTHFIYGFRSQDWFACRSRDKQGLLWSGIVDDARCPLVDDLRNDAGWCWYLVHKTSKKDEAAERPSDVLLPLSGPVREMIEEFRGIDPVRVFPLRTSSRTYSKEFLRLLERAGLSDKERVEAGKPIIRLSLGRRDVASFRKSCSAMWSREVSRAAASYLLHHAVAEEWVSKTTTEHYLQNHDILREITAKIDHLEIWKQIGIQRS